MTMITPPSDLQVAQQTGSTEASNPASSLFAELHAEREAFLERAYDNCELTIPSLIRRNGDNSYTDPDAPWESIGAFLLNNLTNKIVLSLFPAGLPWIKLSPSRDVIASLAELDDEERGSIKAGIDAALSVVEREDFSNAVAEDGDRSTLTRAVKHLLNVGSYCLQVLDDATLKGRSLKTFVTRRDGQGTVIEAALVDPIAYSTAPDDVKDIVMMKKMKDLNKPISEMSPEELRTLASAPVLVYTHILLSPVTGRWEVQQYVEDSEVDNTKRNYARTELPFMFPVFSLHEGENFGRTYTEDFLADLELIDGQSEAVQVGTAIAAQFIRMVRPGGVTSKKALQDARSGDVITGAENDVATLRADKNADFQASLNLQDRTIQRLGRAYLLNSTVQRQGDRVTAEEIRFLAQELEDQLGGAYADLEVTLQRPYASAKLSRLQDAGRAPVWQRDQVSLTITTGAAALTRQAKTSGYIRILTAAGQILGPQVLGQRVNPETLFDILGEGEGLSTDGLLLTEEQLEDKANREAARNTVTAAAPEAIRQVGQAAQAQQPQV